MFSWQLSNDTPTAFVNIGKLNVVAGDVTAASLILIICGFSVVVIFLRLSSAARSVRLALRAAFVSFARALIAKPDVIFADEPTGNLDSKSGGEVMELLQNVWKKMGKALVVITHDSRIARMADRQFQIVDGVLTEVTAK